MSRAQGSGAAALVPLLLAFLREPARERPRYTAGREAIEGGDHVMRFAQGRFPPHVVARTSPAERIELREAALAFIRQVCLWDNATHYQVLCLRPGARREEVKENYHLLMGLIHPDRRDGTWQTIHDIEEQNESAAGQQQSTCVLWRRPSFP